MIKSKRIILGSTSAFRKKLLEDAGIPFISIAALGDELTITGYPPSELARKRAEFKAFDVANQMTGDCIVIGADQVLGLNGKSYDKARDPEEATIRLQEFQGQTHFLYSAFCLVEVKTSPQSIQMPIQRRLIFTQVVDIAMKMRPLSREEISAYVATNEWQGCVGCYRIEGEGRKLFNSIGADESSIIGLPIMELKDALSKLTSIH